MFGKLSKFWMFLLAEIYYNFALNLSLHKPTHPKSQANEIFYFNKECLAKLKRILNLCHCFLKIPASFSFLPQRDNLSFHWRAVFVKNALFLRFYLAMFHISFLVHGREKKETPLLLFRLVENDDTLKHNAKRNETGGFSFALIILFRQFYWWAR